MGYFGSVLLLIICLSVIFLTPEAERNFYTRICFAITGSGGLDLVTLRLVSYLEEKNLR